MTLKRWFHAVLITAALGACGGADADRDDLGRDLHLAPAESILVLNDRPVVAQAPQLAPPAPVERRAQPPIAPRPKPRVEPPPPPPEPVEEPAPETSAPAEADVLPPPLPIPTARAGTAFGISVTQAISTRHNRAGDPVRGTVQEDVRDADGNVVIPRGALLRGRVSELEQPDDANPSGRMRLRFTSVEFGGTTHPIEAEASDLPTTRTRRGNAAGDAAKVGAGAVIGGILGNVIGGNKKGTIIGAGAGAAAGAIAASARDWDINLNVAAPIFCTVTAPFAAPPLIYRTATQ